MPIELGAEFLHGAAPETRALMSAAGVARGGHSEEHWISHGGRPRPLGDIFSAIKRGMRPAASLRKDLSFEAWLASHRRAFRGEAFTFARLLVEGFDAADPARISTRSVAESGPARAPPTRRSSAARRLRRTGPRAGRGGAARWARASKLHSPVTAVRWRRGHVEVEGRFAAGPSAPPRAAPSSRCRSASCKLAPDAPCAVRFSPPLCKDAALAHLARRPGHQGGPALPHPVLGAARPAASTARPFSTRPLSRSRPSGPPSPCARRCSSPGPAARAPPASPTPVRKA